MGVRSLYGDIKHLSGQNIAGSDAAADHGRPCTIDAGIRPLRPAQSEFHDSVSSCSIADPGGLGGNQALVIDDVQNGGFHELGLHDRGNHLDHGFPGKHDASFRNGVDASGETEGFQIVQKILIEDTEAPQIGKLFFPEMQVFNIFNDLLKPGADGITGFHRVIPVKGVENNRFVPVHIPEISLHHRQFIQIGHEGEIACLHEAFPFLCISYPYHNRNFYGTQAFQGEDENFSIISYYSQSIQNGQHVSCLYVSTCYPF